MSSQTTKLLSQLLHKNGIDRTRPQGQEGVSRARDRGEEGKVCGTEPHDRDGKVYLRERVTTKQATNRKSLSLSEKDVARERPSGSGIKELKGGEAREPTKAGSRAGESATLKTKRRESVSTSSFVNRVFRDDRNH